MMRNTLNPARRAAMLAAAGSLLGGGGTMPASAQDIYPSRPVKLVVPAPPGGLTDTIARLLGESLQRSLGQPFVVDNRTGAAGMMGTQFVVDSPADGYTVLVTSTTNHVLAPLTQKGSRTDPQRDLQAIGLVLQTVGILAVPASLPVRSLPELIADVRAHPGKWNYGSTGIGSAGHVHSERFKALAGIDLFHVPYRGGAPLVQALSAGEVQVAMLDYGSAEAALAAGRIRALVQSGSRRHPALSSVPTFAEAGWPGYDPSFWVGLAVPRATPQVAVDRLGAALATALSETRMKARAQALGWTLADGSAQALTRVAAQDTDIFRAEVNRLNLDRQ